MFNLSIVIPIYKEVENINKLAESLNTNIKIENCEILFIDDDSSDGSEEILKKLSENSNNIKYIIRKNEKKDLSKSCILGFENTKYENILVMDGDLQHDPKDINNMIKTYQNDKPDIVVGSRNIFKKKNEGLSFIRLNASKILILIISIFLGKRTADPMSGFFLFKKELYTKNKNNLYAKGYKILMDLIYSSKDDLKIVDVDINFRSRVEGSSKMSLKIIYLLSLVIFQKFLIKMNIFK